MPVPPRMPQTAKTHPLARKRASTRHQPATALVMAKWARMTTGVHGFSASVQASISAYKALRTVKATKFICRYSERLIFSFIRRQAKFIFLPPPLLQFLLERTDVAAVYNELLPVFQGCKHATIDQALDAFQFRDIENDRAADAQKVRMR